MKVFFNKMDYKESNKFVVDGFIVNGLTDLLWTGLVDNPPHDSDLEKHLKKNVQHSYNWITLLNIQELERAYK